MWRRTINEGRDIVRRKLSDNRLECSDILGLNFWVYWVLEVVDADCLDGTGGRIRVARGFADCFIVRSKTGRSESLGAA